MINSLILMTCTVAKPHVLKNRGVGDRIGLLILKQETEGEWKCVCSYSNKKGVSALRTLTFVNTIGIRDP